VSAPRLDPRLRHLGVLERWIYTEIALMQRVTGSTYTQAELSRLTGSPTSAVNYAVQRLTERGLVRLVTEEGGAVTLDQNTASSSPSREARLHGVYPQIKHALLAARLAARHSGAPTHVWRNAPGTRFTPAVSEAQARKVLPDATLAYRMGEGGAFEYVSVLYPTLRDATVAARRRYAEEGAAFHIYGREGMYTLSKAPDAQDLGPRVREMNPQGEFARLEFRREGRRGRKRAAGQ